MKIARLPVAWGLAEAFERTPKPDGFRILWERHVTDDFGNVGVEYLIEGPFPAELEDSDRVGLAGSQTVENGVIVSIAWQWLDEDGKAIGDEMVVDLT